MVNNMFEGNKSCTLCSKDLPESKDRYFGIGTTGYTYAFCKDCHDTKKDKIKGMLHGNHK